MTKNVYHFKGKFKIFLFVLAMAITVGFLVYTLTLVHKLQNQSREFLKFKVQIFEENINNEEVTDLNFFFTNVILTADYPIIYTDADRNPQIWRNVDIPNVNSQELTPKNREKLLRLMAEYEESNAPIPISYQGNILGYYFYGESAIIKRLRWLPVIEIIVVGMFVLIGYAGFHSIKKNEERLIWVGMAKETAHQLGTPLSSQIGWLEYLKLSPSNLDKVIPELEKDLMRLQTITNRFSQIGSLPDMKPENLTEMINETVEYFQNRIPRKNGKIQLCAEFDPAVTTVNLNRDLFSWVLENLIKNGLDALEDNGGTITISSGRQGDSQLYIDVSGWGLGLSLAKRIVEDYHGGKLSLKETQVGMGSTFRILLRVV
jgi:hypothetical protein